MPLVINVLRGGHTDTHRHTHRHTDTHTHAYRRTNQSNFKKPGVWPHAPGLKIQYGYTSTLELNKNPLPTMY